MEWQIRLIEILLYSTLYGSVSILILLLLRKIAGKKASARERMILWWGTISVFVLTMVIFPKGSFTTSYSFSNLAFPPIKIVFHVVGHLTEGDAFVRTGTIDGFVKGWYNGNWHILWSGSGNILLNAIFSLFTIGMLVYLVYNALIYINLKNKLKGFEACGDVEILELVEGDRLFLGILTPIIKKVPQQFFKEITCPCIVGFSSPELVIVSEQWERLSLKEKQAVITHELFHIKKKDNYFNLFLLLLQSVQWFNPIMWMGLKYLRQDLECHRDTQIVDSLTESEKKNYASAIIKIARMNGKVYRTSMHSGMLCSSGIGYRVWLLINKDKKWSALGIAITIIMSAFIVCAILQKEVLGFINTSFILVE